MYDKSFEYRSKGKAVESNILRLETSYRRQNIPLSEFFNDAFVFRLVSQFFRDWHSLSFPHQIIAEKGTKGSQIEKARRIMEVGRDAYLTESRKDMEAGIITPNSTVVSVSLCSVGMIIEKLSLNYTIHNHPAFGG